MEFMILKYAISNGFWKLVVEVVTGQFVIYANGEYLEEVLRFQDF